MKRKIGSINFGFKLKMAGYFARLIFRRFCLVLVSLL